MGPKETQSLKEHHFHLFHRPQCICLGMRKFFMGKMLNAVLRKDGGPPAPEKREGKQTGSKDLQL